MSQLASLFEIAMRKIEPWLLQAWGRGEDILPLFSKKTPAKCQKYERIWRLMKIRSYLKRYPGKAIEMAVIWQSEYNRKQEWAQECSRVIA